MARDDEMMMPGDDASDELVPTWTTDGHLDEGTIHAWLDDAFDAAHAAVIAAHVDSCKRCSESVAEARGFIAGASRMVRALDAVPSGVVPQSDVERVASRIVAAASAASAVPAESATVVPITAARARRAWYASPAFRSAAAVLLMIAGGGYLLSRDPNVSMRETVLLPADSASRGVAPAAAAASVAEPAASKAVAERLADQLESPARRDKREVRPQTMSAAKPGIAEVVAKASDAVASDSNKTVMTAEATRGAAVSSARAAVPLPAAPPSAGPIVTNMAGKRVEASTSVIAREPAIVALQQPLNDSGHVVTGRILSSSGAPLAGVAVTANGAINGGAATDSAGEYRLRVMVDTVRVLARRIGYSSVSRFIDLRSGDSSRVDLRMEPSVQALSAVTVQQSAKELPQRARSTAAFSSSPPDATGCWSLRASRVATVQLPTHLLMQPPITPGSFPTRWINWPTRGMTTNVVMSIDRAAMLRGMGSFGGDTLELTMTLRGSEWSGKAVQRREPANAEQSIVLSSAPESVCKM